MGKEIQLIVGLGNPGANYQAQRHNIGAQWIQGLANDLRLKLVLQSKLQSHLVKLPASVSDSSACYLAYPTTYMNDSGASVSALSRYYKIAAENILIIHDELDLAPGVVKLKQGGGHAGHNGLRDIIQKLGGCRDFWRLRIGIGHPRDLSGRAGDDSVANYVLQKPRQGEQALIDRCIEDSQRLLSLLLSGDFEGAVQRLANRV